jgi:excisionase family DNA binding protein
MRVSTMTVYRLIREGELPAIRVGKHFRLRVADVDRFLSSRTVNPTDHDPTDTEEHRWRAG